MGTSSSYGGPGGGTPLVPSWVDDDGSALPAVPIDGETESDGPSAPADVATTPDTSVPQPPPAPGRFTAPRTNLTRFASSGGTDRRALGRAIAGYVSTATGGAGLAARRMGASRRASVGLVSFLGDVQTRGVPAALRALNLEALAGGTIEDIFIGLADFVCPVGGTVDDGIAREAFIETIAQLETEGITDLAGLTAAQIETVFEIYATHAIRARICNDIGAKAVSLPASPHAAANVEAQLQDFIRGGVADALTAARATMATLTVDNVLRFVEEVYTSAFEVLRTMGEAEEGQ